MMSLRTVHTQLNAHMHNKLKMVPWSAYLCCNEYQTKEYIHQKCKRHDKETFSVHVTALYMPVIKQHSSSVNKNVALSFSCSV